MSYDLTAQALKDFLPVDNHFSDHTVRNHTLGVVQRVVFTQPAGRATQPSWALPTSRAGRGQPAQVAATELNGEWPWRSC